MINKLPVSIVELMQRAQHYQNAQNFLMAEAIYRHVLERQPRNVDALHFLGLILYIKRDTVNQQEGLKLVDKSIKLAPSNPNFILKRSLLFIDCKDWVNAEKLCESIVANRPQFSEGHFNLANVLANTGRLKEAEARVLKAIGLNPKQANSHALLGLILVQQLRTAEASHAFQVALGLDNLCYEALSGLGNLLTLQNKHSDARRLLEGAINLRPEVASNYDQLATGYILSGNFTAARALLQTGLTYDETNNACLAKLMHVYLSLGQRETANQIIEKIERSDGLSPAMFHFLLNCKNFDPTISASELFALHQKYGALVEAPYKNFWPKFARDRDVEKQLRIAYVSGDFRTHVVANFIAPILENHTHAQYKVICYSNLHADDETTGRLKGYADEWHSIVNMLDDEIVNKIRGDEIDILVDLSGHTDGNILRLFAQKLAPVQVTWIGYPGTTGLTAMDYRITSNDLDPLGVTDQFHTESLLRLPFLSAPFTPSDLSPPVNTLPALKNGYITFGCLNTIQKLNEAVAACWAPILKQLPNSKLVICDAGNAETATWVLALFDSLGVPADQLVLKPRMQLAEFLRMLNDVDLALDPFPYNGGTTTAHACWMGVPVITWPGKTTTSNVGAAILRPLGLGGFIVTSQDAYVAKALELAGDLAQLAAIRGSMRERMLSSKGVTPQEITHAVETLYRSIWRTWCENDLENQS